MDGALDREPLLLFEALHSITALPNGHLSAAHAVPELRALLSSERFAVPAVDVIGRLGPAAEEAATALTDVAFGRGGGVLRIKAAAAHRAVTGAADVAERVAAEAAQTLTFADYEVRALGRLGHAAAVCLPRIESRLAEAEPENKRTQPRPLDRADAGLALWRITGDRDTAIQLVNEVPDRYVDPGFLDDLTGLGLCPASWVPRLRDIATRPTRLTFESSRRFRNASDVPGRSRLQREDDLLRDAAQWLLGLPTA